MLAILAALTIARTLAYLVFGPVHFDSDQAVLGIMAIDLAHLKALPIVMYGQTYLLPVISWLAAPLFAVFGPSIALLKAPFLLINVLAVGALYALLRKAARLNVVASACVAATLALPTVVLSQSFMNASGGHIEPVLYVPMLFFLRKRPVSLGLAGAFVVAHRELTAVALAALAIVELIHTDDRGAVVKRWLITGGLFAIGLLAVRGIAHWSTNYGGLVAEYTPTHDVADGFAWLAKDTSILLGLGPHDLRDVGFVLPFVEGSRGSLVAIAVLAVLATIALARRWRIRRRDDRVDAADYLVITCALIALAFAGREMTQDTLLGRYLFILALVPAALAMLIFVGETNTVVRALAGAALLWIAGANAMANARYYRALSDARLPDRLGAVATFLEDRGVTTGLAPYWVAYNLTFRTGARVHIASSELVRIPAYQTEYETNREHAVRIDAGPCEPGSDVTVRGVAICLK